MMSKLVLAGAVVLMSSAILAETGSGDEGALTYRQRLALRRQQRVASIRRILLLRECVGRAQDAEEEGDLANAREARERAREHWLAIDEQVRAAIETRHPGTRDRLKAFLEAPPAQAGVTYEATMRRDGDTIVREGAAATSTGRGASYSGTTTISGSVREHDGTITTLNGREATVSGSTVREGDSLTHEHTVTGEDGTVLRQREGTTTRSDGALEHEHTITRRDGSTKTVESTHTRTEPGVIEHERTVTGSGGRETTFSGTSTRDGSTVSHEGTISGSNGRTASVEGTTTRDGSTRQHESTITSESGRVLAAREATTTREGSTVSREQTVTGLRGTRTSEQTRSRQGAEVSVTGSATRERRSYRDDYDIFGARKARTGHNGAAGARRARSR